MVNARVIGALGVPHDPVLCVRAMAYHITTTAMHAASMIIDSSIVTKMVGNIVYVNNAMTFGNDLRKLMKKQLFFARIRHSIGFFLTVQ